MRKVANGVVIGPAFPVNEGGALMEIMNGGDSFLGTIITPPPE